VLAIRGDESASAAMQSTSSTIATKIATERASSLKTTTTSPPVKEPTAQPSAEGTESTAPSIPDEEEGNFVPITDIQGSQVPSATPTVETKVTINTNTNSNDVSETVKITESEDVVEQSSSFIKTLLFIIIVVITVVFMYRRYILKYFDRRIPYGTTLYTQVPSNER
jgi:hypothetical protein